MAEFRGDPCGAPVKHPSYGFKCLAAATVEQIDWQRNDVYFVCPLHAKKALREPVGAFKGPEDF